VAVTLLDDLNNTVYTHTYDNNAKLDSYVRVKTLQPVPQDAQKAGLCELHDTNTQ